MDTKRKLVILGISIAVIVISIVAAYLSSKPEPWHEVAWITSENPTQTFWLDGEFSLQLMCDSVAWVSVYSASGELQYHFLINPWTSLKPGISYHGEVYLQVEPVLDVDEWSVYVTSRSG